VGGNEVLGETGVGAGVDCVTVDSLLVVVVVVDSPVDVQDERTMAQAAITGINRINFFIIGRS
jgi:hypothetical protein